MIVLVRDAIYVEEMNLFEQDKFAQLVSWLDSEDVPFFQRLTKRRKHVIAQNSKVLMFKPGEIIYPEGEQPKGIYVIRRGDVKVLKFIHIYNKIKHMRIDNPLG